MWWNNSPLEFFRAFNIKSFTYIQRLYGMIDRHFTNKPQLLMTAIRQMVTAQYSYGFSWRRSFTNSTLFIYSELRLKLSFIYVVRSDLIIKPVRLIALYLHAISGCQQSRYLTNSSTNRFTIPNGPSQSLHMRVLFSFYFLFFSWFLSRPRDTVLKLMSLNGKRCIHA